MRTRITEQLVRRVRLTPPARGNRLEWDSDVVGFGVRITANRAVSFVLRYIHNGRERRLTIGRHPDLSAGAARDRAIELRGEVVRGHDPLADRQAGRRVPSLKALCERYLREYAEMRKKPSSAREDRRLIDRRILPALGNRRLNDITRQDIGAVHNDLSSTPYEANRTLALLSKLFNLAEAWGLRSEGPNPCQKISKFPEKKRKGSLTADELRILGSALQKAKDKGTMHVRVLSVLYFLLFTGRRVSEACRLEWAWVSLEDGVIYFPDSKTGPKEHRLGASAVQLLSELQVGRGHSGAFVFPALRDPNRPMPISTVEHVWQRLRDIAPLPGKRLHDLRHTRGSWAAKIGANAFLIRDILAHKNVGTTDRYINFETRDLRDLNNAVDQQLTIAMSEVTKNGKKVIESGHSV